MSSNGKSSAEAGGGAALVPKLRFPEFQGAGPWETAPGNELFQQVNNREAPPGLPILAITQEHGAIPRYMIDYHVSVTEKSLETYKEVRPGDFVISLRSFQGGIEFSDYHGICSPAYVILRKRGRLSDLFYQQHFKSHDFIQQLTRNLEGLRDGKMISYRQFSELRLLKPSLPEQQKIAECLDSADALITVQKQKVEALKAHKKGLLQQLFPFEGETFPRLRFPEFRQAAGWRTYNGNNLFKQVSDRNVNSGFPVLAITQEHGAIPRQLIDYHVSVTDKSLESYKLVRFGDFIISLRSFQGGIEYSQYDGICSPAYVILQLKGEGLNDYFRHYMKTERFIDALTRNIEGLRDGKMISYSQFSDVQLVVPELPEQQRIADCLTSLDVLITAETRLLDTLKTHKEGLMQQLFPQIGESDA